VEDRAERRGVCGKDTSDAEEVQDGDEGEGEGGQEQLVSPQHGIGRGPPSLRRATQPCASIGPCSTIFTVPLTEKQATRGLGRRAASPSLQTRNEAQALESNVFDVRISQHR
jgi:hypothetical protein